MTIRSRILSALPGRVAVLAAGLIAWLLFPGLVGSPAWGDIYTFQDENGVINFSNVPSDSRYRFFMKEQKPVSSNRLCAKTKKGYDGLIQKMAKEKGVDPLLVCAVVEVESNYDNQAISIKGAKGLMQLMPSTAKDLGVKDVFHPEQNLAAGMCYLKGLIDKYKGSLMLALAAYNAGEAAVDQYRGIPPYAETRQYVQKVLAAYEKRKESTRP